MKLNLPKVKFALLLTILFFGFFVLLFFKEAQASFLSADHVRASAYGATTGCYDLRGIGAGVQRVRNNSAYDYFVPLKTLAEWNNFRNHLPASVSVLDCCNNNPPSNVYGMVAYFTDHNCGHTPGCGISAPYAGENNAGATCGFSGRWRAVQCAALYHPVSICDGDPCLTGIDKTDYGWPKYCYGHYDSLVGACVYDGKTTGLNSPNGTITYTAPTIGGVLSPYFPSFNLYTGQANPGTWGGCYTQAACGNGTCSSGFGETCSTCPADCGPCPQVCGDYNCSAGENCSNCPTDCGSCLCSDFTNPTDCENNSCFWDWNSYTCVASCANHINEYECDNDSTNCVWDYYNYICSSRGPSCGQYGYQYDCQANGCVWNPYNYTCN